MSRDIGIRDCMLTFLPVETRVPLKFGPEVTTFVTCARVRLTVSGADGRTGRTPGRCSNRPATCLPAHPAFTLS